jgi:uncharacterized membrane protein
MRFITGIGLGIGLGAILDRALRRGGLLNEVLPHRKWITVHRSFEVPRPGPEVFDLWADFERLPRFMRDVVEVRYLGEGRSHWRVRGALGVRLSWNTVLTRFVPGQMFAWKTEPDASIPHAGRVRVTPLGRTRSRVDVDLVYRPLAGELGDRIARWLHADPGARLDSDERELRQLLAAPLRQTAP